MYLAIHRHVTLWLKMCRTSSMLFTLWSQLNNSYIAPSCPKMSPQWISNHQSCFISELEQAARMAFLPGLKKQINKVKSSSNWKINFLTFFSRQISLWVRESVGWKEQNLMMISTGDNSKHSSSIFQNKNPTMYYFPWTILQHGKEDGPLQRVGGWLADQNERVPSGADKLEHTYLSQSYGQFSWSLYAVAILSHWSTFFQPNPTVRAKMAAVKVVFSFSNIFLISSHL